MALNKDVQAKIEHHLRTVKRSDLYSRALNRFIKYFGLDNPNRLLLIEERGVLEYIKHLTECGLSRNSIRTYHGCLRGFYATFVKAGFIKSSPFDLVPPPPEEYSNKHQALLPGDVKKIMNAAKSPRDCAVLALFFTGRRATEIRNLYFKDVKLTPNGLLEITLRNTKAKRDEIHLLPEFASKAVLKHIETRKYPDERLFPISDRTVRRIFKRAATKAGFPDISSHTGRTTAITTMLDLGYSHREVQRLSGHSSVLMVEKYDKRYRGAENSPEVGLKYD